MNPDEIDALYEYQYPFIGACDGCGTDDTTIFYETPAGEQLCKDCARTITKPSEDSGLELDAVTLLENDPERGEETTGHEGRGTQESTKHLQEVLTKVTPAQRGGRDTSLIEYDYDHINWAAVQDGNRVGAEETIGWGGYPGAFGTVNAGGFDAVRAYFDSTLAEANVVYLTDEGAYVFDYILDRVSEEQLKAEMLRAVSELSRDGVIDGLQPIEAVAPPDLYEHISEFIDDIQAFELKHHGTELVCRAVLDRERDPLELLTEIRTIGGIEYPKPDRLEIVSEID